MLLDFFYELRRHKVPVGLQEWMALLEALARGLHQSSLTGFYHLARSLLVHSEAHFDAFDQAFAVQFQGVEGDALELTAGGLDQLVVEGAGDGASSGQPAPRTTPTQPGMPPPPTSPGVGSPDGPSVGYGSHLNGLAPLFTMLNSCAPNITVVNIDNGFGAGFCATMINSR